MIRRVSNTPNIRKNEIVAKKRREKFKPDARRHNIKIRIAKAKITRLDLNSCDYHALWNAKDEMLDKFRSRRKFYIANFD